MNGFLLIDKPKNWTSFDVVKKVSHLLGERKIGHAGTLDKLATGLMILALGEATKFLEYLIGLDKEYEVEIRFGAVSETYDAEGPIKEIDGFNAGKILKKSFEGGILRKIDDTIKRNFLGEIEQIPPRYSALKIAGKRASDRARTGEEIAMKSRKIRVDAFEIISLEWPRARFKVRCGSGTYIRSLVYDLGAKLGWGAYVTDLRRIRIGNLGLEDEKVINSISKNEAFAKSDLNKNIEHGLVSIEDFIWHKMAKDSRIIEISDSEFLILKDGGIVPDKKLEHGVLNVAMYKAKVVGILENFREGIKFRKKIND